MSHPYKDAPAYRRWSRAVTSVPMEEVDPVVTFPFRITATDKIVTAGSCFAQHIARHLKAKGFAFLDAEPAHPLIPADALEKFGYGLFSARYGNIYTGRQLLQLVRRAYGRFQPQQDVWEDTGAFYDPFRPSVQPGGFPTLDEYRRDREQHFAAVRRAIEDADYFVFTLGLTECWATRTDGAVFPVCPGTVAGAFDPAQHVFLNLSVQDVIADMQTAIAEMRAVNPDLKIVLTVSPVPLAATAEDRHVLTATTYSKSVLRVAAEELTKLHDVAYFPSYEIITGGYARGAYFAQNLRDIQETGVEHVMRLFFKHAADITSASPTQAAAQAPDRFVEDMTAMIDTICDEGQLDRD